MHLKKFLSVLAALLICASAHSQSLSEKLKRQEEAEQLRKMMEADKRARVPKNPSEMFTQADVLARGQRFSCDESKVNEAVYGGIRVLIDNSFINVYWESERDPMSGGATGRRYLSISNVPQGDITRKDGILTFTYPDSKKVVWQYELSTGRLYYDSGYSISSSICQLVKYTGP